MNPTILIADDDQDLLEVLELRCANKGYTVLTAEDGMTAISTVDVAAPDVICLDVQMPSGTGLSVAEMVLTDNRLSQTPVILMTGSNDPKLMERAADLKVPVVKKGGDFWERLQPVLDTVIPVAENPANDDGTTTTTDDSLRKTEPMPPLRNKTREPLEHVHYEVTANETAAEVMQSDKAKTTDPITPEPAPRPQTTRSSRSTVTTPYVLHIEDDGDMSAALKIRLESCGAAVVRAFSGMEGYRLAMRYPIDLILLDYELPDGQGDYILRRLKETPAICELPVIVVSGRNDGNLRRKMLNLGAAACLGKPIDFKQLKDEMSKHISLVSPRLMSVPHWRDKANSRVERVQY